MKGVNLNSGIIYLMDDFPEKTKKLMIMVDDRGWAIRCYDSDGKKLTTMVPDETLGASGVDVHLVRQERI